MVWSTWNSWNRRRLWWQLFILDISSFSIFPCAVSSKLIIVPNSEDFAKFFLRSAIFWFSRSSTWNWLQLRCSKIWGSASNRDYIVSVRLLKNTKTSFESKMIFGKSLKKRWSFKLRFHLLSGLYGRILADLKPYSMGKQ